MNTSCRQDIRNARAKVNSLQSEIDDIGRQIDRCLAIGDFPSYAAIPGLKTSKLTVEGLKELADTALRGALFVVESAEYVSMSGGVAIAHGAIETERLLSKVPLEAARLALSLTRSGGHRAVEIASGLLEVTRKGCEAAFDAAKKELKDAQEFGQKAVMAAKKAVDGLADTAEWLAYQTKVAAVKVAKESGSGILKASKETVDVVEEVEQAAIDTTKGLIELFSLFIDVTDFQAKIDLDKAIGNCAFEGHIKGTFHDDPFEYDVSLYPNNAKKMIEDVYDKYVF